MQLMIVALILLSADRFYCETCGMDETDAVPDCPMFSEGAKAPVAVDKIWPGFRTSKKLLLHEGLP